MCDVCLREHESVADGDDIAASLRKIDERIVASSAPGNLVNQPWHQPSPRVYHPSRQPSNATPISSPAWDFARDHGFLR